jgi:predicted lipid-binding transport protein (Tim44 family)
VEVNDQATGIHAHAAFFFIKFIMGTLRFTAFEKSTKVGCYSARSGGNVHRRSIFGACILISAQHSTAQHSTAQRSTAQHSTAQHSTAQHSTVQNMEEGLVIMGEKHGLDQDRSMYKQC